MRNSTRTIATLAAIAGTAVSLAACSTPSVTTPVTTPAAQVTGSDATEAWNFYNSEPGMSDTRNIVAHDHLNVAYVATLRVPESADLGDALSPTYTAVFDAHDNDWHVFSITRD